MTISVESEQDDEAITGEKERNVRDNQRIRSTDELQE